MMERSTNVQNVTIRRVQRVISGNTSWQSTKERNTNVENANTKELQMEVSKNTIKASMKELRSFNARYVHTWQHRGVESVRISLQLMVKRNTNVVYVGTRQLQKVI